MNPSRASRPYHLVLFGASGFTGRLVAEYLAEARPKDLVWALAGRSRQKLEAVRAGLAAIDPALATLAILIGDSDDEASLLRIAEQARVVCTTVGPYARHGRLLIGACARRGTDYCDLTGETQFVREAIDRHQATAEETGARIVPSCGFDSIPSDLGVFLLHRHFAARGQSLASAKLYVDRLSGGVSGGTIGSMLNILDEAGRDPSVRRILGDPYALNPDRAHQRGPDRGDQMTLRWDAADGRWTAPFVMAAINTRVVRRSNALLDFAYGRDFRYAEVMAFRRGPRGLMKAAGLTAGLGAFMALASTRFTREQLEKRLPGAGEGPSKRQREAGSFRIRIAGTAQGGTAATGNPPRAVARVEGRRDPGYGETARMLGEAALCLCLDELPTRGGFLTPASCMGEHLVERLRRADMVLTVEDTA